MTSRILIKSVVAFLSDSVNLVPALVIVRKVIILKDVVPSFLAQSVQGEWHSKGIHLNPQYHVHIFVKAV